MFWTVTVMRGSRRASFGHSRPSALLSRTTSSSVSTQTGTTCGVPSERIVATSAKFLPSSRSRMRPSSSAMLPPIDSSLVDRLPRPSNSMRRMLDREREQVAGAARRLAAAGLVAGTSGNVSARRDDRVAVTPTGGMLAELEPDQVTVVDLEGNVVGGDLAPTSEI